MDFYEVEHVNKERYSIPRFKISSSGGTPDLRGIVGDTASHISPLYIPAPCGPEGKCGLPRIRN